MQAQRVRVNQREYGIDIVVSKDEFSEYLASELSQGSENVPDGVQTASVGSAHYMIPETALATYKQLLGTNSDRETIQYIMYIREHGEPQVGEGGVNAWTSAYNELESKLELQASKGITEFDVDETDETALDEATAKVKALAASLAKASANLISTASASDDEEPTGIDKTRSMLGLPSRNVSKATKLQLLSAASANVMAADETSDLDDGSAFYEISDDVLKLFDQDNVSNAEADFLDAITTKRP